MSVRCVLLSLLAASLFRAAAMEITGYDPVVHNRFASGYPAAPVANTDPLFLGLGQDWSGVGWASADATKSFGFVSPQHYLVARHYGGAAQVRIFGADGTLHERSQRGVTETGLGLILPGQTLGDLSLGALQNAFPSTAMPSRYGVLDLNSASSTNLPTAYNNRPLWIYGRGPNGASSTRIAGTPLGSVTISGNNHYFTTSRTDLQLQSGDSGSPAFAAWMNPNGQTELTLVGNHAAITETSNLHNFLGSHQMMAALNSLMRPDGRALRVVGTPTHTWVGSTSQNLSQNSAWGLRNNQTSASDRYVLFDGGNSLVNVNSNFMLRGLYFKSATSFSFNGSSTLTVGRGGVTLYGAGSQSFTAPLALGADQVWNSGTGVLSVQALNVGPWLLEVLGEGRLSIQGSVTGTTGGLALGGGELHLGGNASHTGTTWAHEGTLRVDGDLSSSAAVVLGPSAWLTGSGRLPELRGNGGVKPSGTVLTARAVDGSQGLSFEFTFNGAGPGGNEVLRLLSPAPFTAALSSASTVRVYLAEGPPQAGQRLRGGFFTDAPEDFLGALQSATFEVYVWDGAAYVPHADPALSAEWATEAQTLDFGEGPVAGRVLTLGFPPPENTYARWVYEVFPPETPPEDTEPLAAPNSYGIPNLASYGHGLNPLQPDVSQRPFSLLEEGVFVFRWWVNPAALDVAAAVEGSGDLTGTWETVEEEPVFVLRENGLDLYELRLDPAGLLFLRVVWVPLPQP